MPAVSRVKQIRDDVTAAIAVMPVVLSRSIVPVAVWMPPEHDRSDIDATIVEVAPGGREKTIEGRGILTDVLTVNVALFDPLVQGSEDATAEANQIMLEEIMFSLLGQRFAAGSQMICIAASQLQIQDVDHWREKRLFTSVLELKYR